MECQDLADVEIMQAGRGFYQIRVIIRHPVSGNVISDKSKVGRYENQTTTYAPHLRAIGRNHKLTKQQVNQIEADIIDKFASLGWKVKDLPLEDDVYCCGFQF